ncbi:MAG: transposase [Calothrix sp. C42_A2020_038]|nr:transposase [Calothrix sp. C42_A2020_038]
MNDASNSQSWYVIKTSAGNCKIVSTDLEENSEVVEKWGPFDSQGDAIARRIGLIRAGKCQPQ